MLVFPTGALICLQVVIRTSSGGDAHLFMDESQFTLYQAEGCWVTMVDNGMGRHAACTGAFY